MSRTTYKVLVLAALVAGSGCSGTGLTDPQEVGPVIARYAMTALDGNAMPCCAVDSADVHITVVGGTLTFHGPTNYRDTVFTPAGATSAACVHGIPNGANLNTFTYTVTLPDSATYLQLPCDAGTYTLLVVRQLARSGSATIDSVTISFGNFAAGRDHVGLIDSARPFAFQTSVTAPTIVVASPTHRYRFDPAH